MPRKRLEFLTSDESYCSMKTEFRFRLGRQQQQRRGMITFSRLIGGDACGSAVFGFAVTK